jgi:hypothetical protein
VFQVALALGFRLSPANGILRPAEALSTKIPKRFGIPRARGPGRMLEKGKGPPQRAAQKREPVGRAPEDPNALEELRFERSPVFRIQAGRARGDEAGA